MLSVAPEIASGQGQNPTPGAVEKVSMNDQYKDILQQLSESTALAAAGDAAAQTKRLATLKKCFRRCKPLVARNLWALPPMQEVLHEIPISYVERDDTEAAVAAACLIATECVPYLLPAPFTSQRVKNLFMIAGCLTSTAGDVQAEAKGAAAGDSVREKLREEFRTIDQVSLCQMLLLMVLRLTPAPYRHEWDVSIRAKDILEDINQLQGRENELTLITAWATNPQADRSQEFFQYAVVQPVRRLAALGKELIEKEFS